MPSYKLTYFNARGRGEPARLVFAAAGLKYEDCRIQFGELAKLKESGTLPFGQLPVLEVDGKMLAQSMSIVKFVAREAGLSPSDSFEIAQADMVVDGLTDLYVKATAFFLEKDKEKKEALQKAFFENHLPAMMTNLEKLVKANDGKHFAGSKMSYADIVYFGTVDALLQDKALAGLEKYPLLKNLFNDVKSQPGIQKWLKERPVTEF